MADNHAGDAPSEAPEEEVGDETVDVDEPVEDAAVEDETVEPAPDIGRTELKAIRARLTLEEEAEAARRRILGPRRAARRRAASGQPAFDEDDDDLSERLRELVRGVEEETERLQDDVSRLRSAAGRAGATLHEEIERAASELADQSTEELQTTVGQTATESLEALTAAVDSLQETTASLNNVAAGLLASVEHLAKVAPVADQLAQLAAAPPAIPDALARIISDLADQLSALGNEVSSQVQNSVEAALATELGRHEARIEHALARLVDELARLRRRLPVTKKGAAIELTKEQLTSIGQSVGDYLLAAMREQEQQKQSGS